MCIMATQPAAHALLAALLACACLAAVARGSPGSETQMRSLLAADAEEGWRPATVRNSCAFPVTFKAAYGVIKGIDDGKPCPNARPGGACSTQWQTLRPGKKAVLASLPELLWSFSAYIPGSEPRHYLSRQTAEAYLAAADHFGEYCNIEKEKECVWWAVPSLKEDGAGGSMVLTCPEYDPATTPKEPVITDLQVVNECSQPVKIKFAYTLEEGDKGAGCLIDKWFAEERRCITDYQWLEPGEERFIAQTINPYWEFGAQIADNSTHDLARLAQGSFQGWNDTTACPESDAYSDQPYTCEWWAPNCHFCDFNATLAAEPLAITCEGYRPAGPVKASLPKKVV